MLLKKHFRGEGGRFGISQQKLSLPRLPIFPHSFNFVPSDLECCSRSRERRRSLDGDSGEGSLLDDVFPLLHIGSQLFQVAV
jgi:hypothetical protein